MAPRKPRRQTPAQAERSLIRAQVVARNRCKRLHTAELIRLREVAENAVDHDHPDMQIYFTSVDAFERDFGSPPLFSDGLEEYFRRMRFHASLAEGLAQRFNHDQASIAAEAAKPISFTVANPYSDGDQRQLWLEETLRSWKHSVEGPDAVAALPAAVNIQFPFCIPNRFATYPEWSTNGHRDLMYAYYIGMEMRRTLEDVGEVARQSTRDLPVVPIDAAS
ncbi:hypothetical protein B0H16DRAFT_1745787 [Mycena metata]|uniref:Uncharacterized protein n=1 Tax=Mycena metata TaxID=1033252 RepID=A0AAD7H204_9AGAR|nr:hypothetical protein B0H16DRAFT_1745787 [Mycena metata]